MARIEDQVFEKLKAGGLPKDVRKAVSSDSKFSAGLQKYLQWAEKEVESRQNALALLKSEETRLNQSLQKLQELSKELSTTNESLEKRENELSQRIDKMTNQLETLKSQVQQAEIELKQRQARIEDLKKIGYTDVIISKLLGSDAASGAEMLERIETKADYIKLLKELEELKERHDLMERGLTELGNEKESLLSDIQEQKNILDDLQLRTQNFKEAVATTTYFFTTGYNTDDLKRLRKGLDLLGIKGDPKLSLDRLIRGLEGVGTLIKLEESLKESRNELETLEKDIATAKGELKTLRDTLIRNLEEAKTTALSKVQSATDQIQRVAVKKIKNTGNESIMEIGSLRKKAEENLDKIKSTASTTVNKMVDEVNVALANLNQSARKVGQGIDAAGLKALQSLEAVQIRSQEDIKGIVKQCEIILGDIKKAREEQEKQRKAFREEWGKVQAEAGRLEEDLKLARIISTIIKYPSEAKELPFDYALLLNDAVFKFCLVKGLNPKVKAGDVIGKKYSYQTIQSSFEMELMDLINWTKRGLEIVLG